MSLYLENPADTFVLWTGQRLPDGRLVSPLQVSRWTEAEREAAGLYSPIEADPIPEGKVSTGQSVERVDGLVTWVHALINAPQLTLADRRAIAIEALKARRWQVEISGVDVELSTGETVSVSTARGDDRFNLYTQATGAMTGSRVDGATFNFADGIPRSVSNADIIAAGLAAQDHVQGAFDRQGEITTDLHAATTHAVMDAVIASIEPFWA